MSKCASAAAAVSLGAAILLAFVSPPLQSDVSISAALADEDLPEALRLLQLRSVSTSQKLEVSAQEVDDDTYDYVVVGAGTAGSLLVNRLSRMGNVSIALVETGSTVPTTMGDLHPAVRCSLFMVGLDKGCDFCKEFTYSEDDVMWAPKEGRKGINYRHALGGTSSLAVGVHFRDNGSFWSELAVDFGQHWSLPEVEVSQIEHEMLVRREPRAANADHLLFASAAFEAAKSDGAKTMLHPLLAGAGDGPKGILQTTPRYQYENGSMRSAYSAFLRPVLEDPSRRGSLKVISNMTAQFVEIKNGKATGVAILRANASSDSEQPKVLRARREIVLAAGALGSPALLKRSGLEAAPLQDQADVRIAWPCKGCGYIKGLLAEVQKAAGDSSIALPTAKMTFANYGDYGLLVDYKGSPMLITASTEYALASEEFPEYGSASPGAGDLLVAHVVLLQPKDFKGEVTADGDLGIDFKLSDPADVDAAVWGVQLVRRAVDSIAARADVRGKPEAAELQVSDAAGTLAEKLQLDKEIWPGKGTEESHDLAAFLQAGSGVWSFQSATSSCAVGKVVDGELRVNGVQGLRVADASVLPTPPPFGRPLFSTLVAAQVASNLLRKEFEAKH